MKSAKPPSKPLPAMTASISARMRRTSSRPMSWISRGVRRVVVDWRTLKPYQASPSGRTLASPYPTPRGRSAAAPVSHRCSADPGSEPSRRTCTHEDATDHADRAAHGPARDMPRPTPTPATGTTRMARGTRRSRCHSKRPM